MLCLQPSMPNQSLLAPPVPVLEAGLQGALCSGRPTTGALWLRSVAALMVTPAGIPGQAQSPASCVFQLPQLRQVRGQLFLGRCLSLFLICCVRHSVLCVLHTFRELAGMAILLWLSQCMRIATIWIR